MLNQNVINSLVWLYSIFDIKLLTLIAAGFTIYFGYQKVTKKVCISYSINTERGYDPHITNFVVSNKRDSVIVISSIDMWIGDKGKTDIIKFNEPLVLKSYDAKLVEIPKYSNIYNEKGPVFIELFDALSFSLITVSGEVIRCDVESAVTVKSLEGRLYKSSKIFNNIVLTRRMGFVFTYHIKNEDTNVIFDKYGIIVGSSPFTWNAFPDISEDLFGSFLISSGYHDRYDDYALFKVEDNLDTTFVLNKYTMNEKITKSVEEEV